MTSAPGSEIVEQKNSILGVLLRYITTVAGLSLLAKVVGFLRDAAAASKFGTGDEMDAYILALGIPTLIAGLFSNAIPTALITAYSQAKSKEGKKFASGVIANGILLQSLTVFGICLILALLSYPLMELIAGDFPAQKKVLGRELYLVLLIFSVLISVSHALTAALQAEKKFTLSAISSALIPAIALVFLFATYETLGIFSLAYGLVLGTAVHLVVLLFATTQEYGLGCIQPDFKNHAPKQFLGDSMFLFLGGALFGGAVIVDLSVASRLSDGVVATYGYADKVIGIVVTLISVGLGQTLLPYFSEMQASDDKAQARKLVFKLSSIVLGISLPIVIVVWFAADLMIQILFQRGEFGIDETLRVADALRWGSLQFPAAAVGVIASTMVIAMGAVRYLCWVSLMALVLNIILDITLAPIFGLAGILIATAIVHSLSTVLLFKKIIQS